MSKALEIADRLKETYTIAHLPSQAERELRRLVELNAELISALELANRMNQEALPKFNWGASFLDANAIQLLNDAPLAVSRALDKAKGRT